MRTQWRLWVMTVWMVLCMTSAQHVRALYSPPWLWILLCIGLCGAGLRPFVRPTIIRWLMLMVTVACMTVAYTQARAWLRIQAHLNPEWIGPIIPMQGTIDSLPTRTPFGVRFIFKPSETQSDTRLQAAVQAGHLPEQISTAWSDEDLPVSGVSSLRVGQRWSLPVSLKATHATQNPGVFDQEQYWLLNDVRGLANVRIRKTMSPEERPRLLGSETSAWSLLQNTRADFLQQIDHALVGHDDEVVALIKALTFGDQSGISNTQWALFQQTGVTHLISISGVHITMLAMLTAWLTQRLWRRSVALCAWMPSLQAAQWLGLGVALLYALLAGWAIPAQRTVWMLLMWLLLSRLGVANSGVRVLCFSLWWVLWLDPFTILSISFWLSFGAVAWLILAFGESSSDSTADSTALHAARKGFRIIGTQLAIGSALLPLSLYFFHQASLLGVLVNFIAIPMVSILITPLLLGASLLSFSVGWLWPLSAMHMVLRKTLDGLAGVRDFWPQGIWLGHLSVWQVTCMAALSIGVVWGIRQHNRRWLLGSASGLVLILFWPSPSDSTHIGQVRVQVIDIGQGSAILLQTAQHNWLFDTGPKYGEESDAGTRVIMPYLRELGVTHLDVMLLSHNDADHTGGAVSVSHALTVDQVFSSIPREALISMGIRAAHIDACVAGQTWDVDGVRLSMLSPNEVTLHDTQLADNPKSCVLRVDSAWGELSSLLLTGDIDALQEAKLVVSPQGGVRDWHSDVLMMPHHGSAHSSSAPFIEAVAPKIAVAQAGYLNPFKHPAESIMQRYAAAGIKTYNTTHTGTLQFCLGCITANLQIWRDIGQKYWWDKTSTDSWDSSK